MISLKELKERKLVQWALGYVAGAWALLQVAELLSDAYEWPTLVMRLLPLMFGIGFLATLVLAWYHGEKGQQRVSGSEIVVMGAILVLAGASIASVVRGAGAGPTGTEPLSATPAAVPEQGSIAVLPFKNVSADEENEYFSDGITEELLNVLAQVPEIRVASRTSTFAFKGKGVGIDSIARALNVAHVLEGSVRKAGNRVRITAQLIHADNGYQIWSNAYDRELSDIFRVQDEISRAIVDQLRLKLGGGKAGARLAQEETSDPEAHNLLLKAVHFGRKYTREGLHQAVALLEEALARDPAYARAHAQLATMYLIQATRGHGARDSLVLKARAEVGQALELDPSLADAHYVSGLLANAIDWDFESAEASFRRAAELNPSHAFAHSQRAWLLSALGRSEEAIAAARRAVELDPISAGVLGSLGAVYLFAGEAEVALETMQAALALQPENPLITANLALTYSLMNQHDEAVAAVERARSLAPESPSTLGNDAFVYARAGRSADAKRALRALEAHPETGSYELAFAHAAFGNSDRVFALLERAVAEKDPGVRHLRVDPAFGPYRGDPRMKTLLGRVGL